MTEDMVDITIDVDVDAYELIERAATLENLTIEDFVQRVIVDYVNNNTSDEIGDADDTFGDGGRVHYKDGDDD